MPEVDLRKALDSLTDAEYSLAVSYAKELLPLPFISSASAAALPLVSRAVLWESVWRVAPWAIGPRARFPYLSELSEEALQQVEKHPDAEKLLRSIKKIESRKDWDTPSQVADAIQTLPGPKGMEWQQQEYLSRVVLRGDPKSLTLILKNSLEARLRSPLKDPNQLALNKEIVLYALTRIPKPVDAFKLTLKIYWYARRFRTLPISTRIILPIVGCALLFCGWRKRAAVISWCTRR